VRRAQDEVRITATLVNPRTDEAMWTKVYDKGLTKIFAVQAELAQAIAGEMKAVLSPQEKKRVEVVPTLNAEAYDLFLKARGISHRLGDRFDRLGPQEEFLEAAVGLDPRFGSAWARLATVAGYRYATTAGMTQVRLDRTREALAMAEQLIPESTDYFMSRGWFRYSIEHDVRGAEEDFRKVLELAPSYPEPRYGLVELQLSNGLWLQAMQGLHEVEWLDPANPKYAYRLFETALAGRRYAEAEIALRRAETLGRERVEFDRMLLAFMARGEVPRTALPTEADAAKQREFELMCGESLHITSPGNDSVTYTSVEALALAGNGKLAAARALLDSPQVQNYLRKNDSEPKNDAAWANSAVIEALRGNRDEALRRINLALRISPESKDRWDGALVRCNYAMVLTWIGEREKAVEECALRLRTPMPRTVNYPWFRFNVYAMRQHPAFAPLRGDPRFEALLNDPKNNAPLF
jgi:tetratricopeptide (TPR) repeat protein